MHTISITAKDMNCFANLNTIGSGWDYVCSIYGPSKPLPDLSDVVGKTRAFEIDTPDGNKQLPAMFITSIWWKEEDDILEISGSCEIKGDNLPRPFMIDIIDGRPQYTMIQAVKEFLP